MLFLCEVTQYPVVSLYCNFPILWYHILKEGFLDGKRFGGSWLRKTSSERVFWFYCQRPANILDVFFQFSRLSMVNPRHFVESTNLMLFPLIEIWGSWGDVYFTFFWVDYQRVCWCIDLVSRLGGLISGVLSVHSQLTSLSNVVLLSANNPESLCWHICDVHCKACRTKNRALWHSIFHFRIVMVNWFLLAR